MFITLALTPLSWLEYTQNSQLPTCPDQFFTPDWVSLWFEAEGSLSFGQATFVTTQRSVLTG